MKKKRIKINVTQRDIDAAIEDLKFGMNICTSCPVARAFRRHKGFENTWANSTSAHEWKDNFVVKIWDIPLPIVLSNFIEAFDKRKATGIIPAPVHAYVEVPECLLS